MEKMNYVLDGYQFAGKQEYERALQEKETITYLKANMKKDDGKTLLKIYNRSVSKKAFQTVIGTDFLKEIREMLREQEIISPEILAPIPAPGGMEERVEAVQKDSAREGDGKDRAEQRRQKAQAERADYFQKKYEEAAANQKIRNGLIVVLFLVILAMFIITWRSKYSVFTYFTDYKENIRNEVIDELEDWQQELEEREQKLDQQEREGN